MTKGKNGQQIASENVAAVNAWISERNQRRDWHEYAYNNRINRSVLAVELDFAKSVCTQNSTVRALLDSADALWFKFETLEKAAHEAARDRAQVQSSRVTSDNNELQKRVAELEAENRQLRKDLGAFKKQQALVEGGAAGFGI
jgi:cell division protein FtsB